MSSHVPLDLAGIWRGGCLDPSRSLLQVNWLSFKQVIQRPWAAQASTSSPACFIQGSLGTLEAAVSHLCSYSTEKLLLRPRRTQGSQTNRMPLILASHSQTAELWRTESPVPGPQLPQSHSHSRLP